MVELAEQDTAVETIEATVNYILDNGTKIFTLTGEPGTTDADRRHKTRAASTGSARRLAGADREGYRFIRHDTKVVDFSRGSQLPGLLPGDGSAGEDRAGRRAWSCSITPCARPTTSSEARKICEVVRRAQRLHRMVGPTACATCRRRRPTSFSVAASRSCRCGDRSVISRNVPARPAMQSLSTRMVVAWERRYPTASVRPRHLLQSQTPLVLVSRMRRDEALVFRS